MIKNIIRIISLLKPENINFDARTKIPRIASCQITKLVSDDKPFDFDRNFEAISKYELETFSIDDETALNAEDETIEEES